MQYTDVRKLGNDILYRGINENGKRVIDRIKYSPTLYVEDHKNPTEYKSLFGVPLRDMPFSTMKEANDFIKQYDGIANFNVYGEKRYEYCYINKLFPDEVNYSYESIRKVYFDIETELETHTGFPDPTRCQEEISLITIYYEDSDKCYGFGKHPLNEDIANLEYQYCETEKQLLSRFLDLWTRKYPDIICGWNSQLFDIPYIYRRIAKVLGEQFAKKLSPFEYVQEKDVEINNKQYITYDIYGIQHLDFLDLYKKFTYVTRESYKLDHIAYVELNERKVENPYNTFREFYQKDWQLFTKYCQIDTMLVKYLNDKLQLIQIAVSIGYITGTNFSDTLGTVKVGEIFIHKRLNLKNIIPPLANKNKLVGEFDGAYVKEPVTGKLFKWITSFDFAGMYPHLVMQYNISPETLIDEPALPITIDGILNNEYDFSQYTDQIVCANGHRYRTDVKGIIPEIMELCITERKRYKKLYQDVKREYANSHDDKLIPEIAKLNNAQMAFKILGNSSFGMIGNIAFLYYDLRNASAITLSGRLSIQYVGKIINQYLNKVCQTNDADYCQYFDTDSVIFDTLVYANDKQIPIGELYEMLSENEEIENDKGYVRPCNENITTLSFNSDKEVIENKRIKYVMKHTINKEMFKITVGDKSIECTEDHSIIVKRDSEYISISPKEIIGTDEVIYIS